jgi:hypothetical protein
MKNAGKDQEGPDNPDFLVIPAIQQVDAFVVGDDQHKSTDNGRANQKA